MNDGWEYLTLPEAERDRLGVLGREGWELVAVGGEGAERTLYLKRPLLSFRERVTLEQRSRYYEALGREAPSS
jgi:hypothetical protein